MKGKKMLNEKTKLAFFNVRHVLVYFGSHVNVF